MAATFHDLLVSAWS